MTIDYALTVLRLRVQDARDGEAYGICELGEEQGQAETAVVAMVVVVTARTVMMRRRRRRRRRTTSR